MNVSRESVSVNGSTACGGCSAIRISLAPENTMEEVKQFEGIVKEETICQNYMK